MAWRFDDDDVGCAMGHFNAANILPFVIIEKTQLIRSHIHVINSRGPRTDV